MMTHLTELNVAHKGLSIDVRVDVLAQLPRLRTLSLESVEWTDEQLAQLKRLSQLRELRINNLTSDTLISLCQPPHSLRLDFFYFGVLDAEEPVMRALLHLPTLTHLGPWHMHPEAWRLLPQLPLLRRLSVFPSCALTAEQTTSLSTALSGCRFLRDLSLIEVAFRDDNGRWPSNEQQQARWTELLRNVPQLELFTVCSRRAPPMLVALSTHLPRLVFLLLVVGPSEGIVGTLAHPTLQELELRIYGDASLDHAQAQRLVHSARLPQLTRCTYVIHAIGLVGIAERDCRLQNGNE
jgi:hypothetical protein